MFTFDTVINPVRRCFSSTRVRLKPQWNGMRRFRRGTAPRGEKACRRRSARSLRPRCSRSSSSSTNTRSLGHAETENARASAGSRCKRALDSPPVNRIPDLPTAMMLLLEHPGVESERPLRSWNLVWFGSNCANRFAPCSAQSRVASDATDCHSCKADVVRLGAATWHQHCAPSGRKRHPGTALFFTQSFFALCVPIF